MQGMYGGYQTTSGACPACGAPPAAAHQPFCSLSPHPHPPPPWLRAPAPAPAPAQQYFTANQPSHSGQQLSYFHPPLPPHYAHQQPPLPPPTQPPLPPPPAPPPEPPAARPPPPLEIAPPPPPNDSWQPPLPQAPKQPPWQTGGWQPEEQDLLEQQLQQHLQQKQHNERLPQPSWQMNSHLAGNRPWSQAATSGQTNNNLHASSAHWVSGEISSPGPPSSSYPSEGRPWEAGGDRPQGTGRPPLQPSDWPPSTSGRGPARAMEPASLRQLSPPTSGFNPFEASSNGYRNTAGEVGHQAGSFVQPNVSEGFHHPAQQHGFGLPSPGMPAFLQASSHVPVGLPVYPVIPAKPKVVDASSIFRKPGRILRPEHFVVILRGLPGSGKSHLAKALRDVEVMSGGSAPRIHSMDDYFMAEVEKEVDAGDAKDGKRPRKIKKKMMEYCYEPEMEEVYARSMLKAFKKTLEEGLFNFVIVDNSNLTIADFEQYWKVSKSSGYEVYILEPSVTDPTECAKRGVHGFTEQQLREMASRWEPLPPLYLQLDATSLFREDRLDSTDITEVEMDADDMARDEEADHDVMPTGKRARIAEEEKEEEQEPQFEAPTKPAARPAHGIVRPFGAEALGRADGETGVVGSPSAGMPHKPKKQVRWTDFEADKEAAKGFRIGGQLTKRGCLEIGRGAGYSEASTAPLERRREDSLHALWAGRVKEQVKAEASAFRAVFAKRREGLDSDEDT